MALTIILFGTNKIAQINFFTWIEQITCSYQVILFTWHKQNFVGEGWRFYLI